MFHLDIDVPAEKIQAALEQAKQDIPKLLEAEKRSRLGQQGIGTGKYILWDAEGKWRGLFGIIGDFELPPAIDDNAARSALMKIVLHAEQVPVAAMITEAWSASRCAHCGESYQTAKEYKCDTCGREISGRVSENPYRQEVVFIHLSAYPGKTAFTWMYEIKRNEFGVVKEYVPTHLEGTEAEAQGRMSGYWDLQQAEAPIFFLSYENMANANGKPVPQWVQSAADICRPYADRIPTFGVTSDKGFVAAMREAEPNAIDN